MTSGSREEDWKSTTWGSKEKSNTCVLKRQQRNCKQKPMGPKTTIWPQTSGNSQKWARNQTKGDKSVKIHSKRKEQKIHVHHKKIPNYCDETDWPQRQTKKLNDRKGVKTQNSK